VTYLIDGVTEAGEGGLHVPALLHGDEAAVVLLIHPHQEVLGLVVPSTTTLTVSDCKVTHCQRL